MDMLFSHDATGSLNITINGDIGHYVHNQDIVYLDMFLVLR